RLALGRRPLDVDARPRALRSPDPSRRAMEGPGAARARVDRGDAAAVPAQRGVRAPLVAQHGTPAVPERARLVLRGARRGEQPRLHRPRARPRRRRPLDRQGERGRLREGRPRQRRKLSARPRASRTPPRAAGDPKGFTHRIWHSRELDTFSNSLYSSAGFRHGRHAGTGFLDSSPASIAITGTFAITYVRSPYTHALGIAL